MANNFATAIAEIKSDIQTTQVRTIQQVNSNLIMLYFRIGKILSENSKYGNRFIESVSVSIRTEFPGIKGFSTSNLKYMKKFYLEYKDDFPKSQQPAGFLKNKTLKSHQAGGFSGSNLKVHQPGALSGDGSPKVPQAVAELESSSSKVPQAVAQLPWGHNVLLMEKIKDKKVRMIYAEAAIKNGWSRSILDLQIKSEYHKRVGKSANNFKAALPAVDSDLVNNTFKDPYIFDFIRLRQDYKEAELETAMLEKIKRFLLELGKGFSFVGSQYKISTGEADYYIDLLFYHLELNCYIVVELKATEFKPEYIGQLGFYVTAVDETLKKQTDNPTIGLLLCRDKGDKLSVNWSLKSTNVPIGISSFEIMNKLPTEEELRLVDFRAGGDV